jgi:hypothetical protein
MPKNPPPPAQMTPAEKLDEFLAREKLALIIVPVGVHPAGPGQTLIQYVIDVRRSGRQAAGSRQRIARLNTSRQMEKCSAGQG